MSIIVLKRAGILIRPNYQNSKSCNCQTYSKLVEMFSFPAATGLIHGPWLISHDTIRSYSLLSVLYTGDGIKTVNATTERQEFQRSSL